MAGTVVVKLGGSVITDKSRPFSYRADVVSAISDEIAFAEEDVVVVHGGGSYGHTLAMQHGLTTESSENPGSGVSKTRDSMFELNRLVCKTMMEAKLNPYPFSPFDIAAKAGKVQLAHWLRALLKADMTPITFGDVVAAPGGFRVLSGDTILLELARALSPQRCVFALDVDGVYENDARVIIPELTPAKARRMKVRRVDDATGGMKLKLEVAARVAAGGTEVCFVSGYRRNEFSKAIRGLEFYGTKVRA